MEYSSEFVLLDADSAARNRASARSHIRAGQCILSVEPLSTSLFHEEKCRRCDACHVLGTSSAPLLKCSRCAAFWYCGSQCQTRQWRDHHRKICKTYNRFVSSSHYQALSTTQRIDAALLSQLVAVVFPDDDFTRLPANHTSSLVTTFLDLLPRNTVSVSETLPICTSGKAIVPRDIPLNLLSRFGNNNFLLHSHLTSYAHGIYPLASRLFNHSCFPNSATRYIIKAGEPVMMEIVALRDISEGDEISITYADPAIPYETRQTALQMNYGFKCACTLCKTQEDLLPLPSMPQSPDDIAKLEAGLRDYALTAKPTPALLLNMPKHLRPLLNESYLPETSEKFSEASHTGSYDIALPVGRTLLALYMVLYPPNFPQTGMHALELAKTAWNGLVTHDDGHLPKILVRVEKDIQFYLDVARVVLDTFGPEGDQGGPLEEIRVLQNLLDGHSRI